MHPTHRIHVWLQIAHVVTASGVDQRAGRQAGRLDGRFNAFTAFGVRQTGCVAYEQHARMRERPRSGAGGQVRMPPPFRLGRPGGTMAVLQERREHADVAAEVVALTPPE